MTMAENIRYLRLKHGLTQEQLGEVIGVQKSAIRKYESGMVENIPRSSIVKMAEIFGVSPAYLMGWQENTPVERDLDEGKRLWLKIYAEANEETKELFVKMINDFEKLPVDERRFLLSVIRLKLDGQK